MENFRLSASALGIVTPWGGDSRQSCITFLGSEAPLQEQRGCAEGAHELPCNIARPARSTGNAQRIVLEACWAARRHLHQQPERHALPERPQQEVGHREGHRMARSQQDW